MAELGRRMWRSWGGECGGAGEEKCGGSWGGENVAELGGGGECGGAGEENVAELGRRMWRSWGGECGGAGEENVAELGRRMWRSWGGECSRALINNLLNDLFLLFYCTDCTI